MIEISHLSKSFGTLHVLKDVNAQIEKGEIISIIGPSGCGKSTFLRCLNRLEIPDSGAILIDGKNILDKDVDIYKVRQKMGMVFQSFNLFSHLMVIENIMMGPMDLLKQGRQQAYDEGMKLLNLVGLGDKVHSYPHELSGGQKQRVSIARTLAMKPEIVLFDEPTSALDPTMVSEVLGVIRKLAGEGLTMLIVTHEMRFARDVSSRVFYMDDGVVYEEGPPSQIFGNPQKPKTRAFIYRTKGLSLQIRKKNFDLFGMNAEIETFAHKNFFSEKKISALQLVLEELLVHLILPGQEPGSINVDVDISHGELDEKTEFIVKFSGPSYNPLKTGGQDMSLQLINKYARQLSYEKAVEGNLIHGII